MSVGNRFTNLQKDTGERRDGAIDRMGLLIFGFAQNLPESFSLDVRHRVVNIGRFDLDRQNGNDRRVGQGAGDLCLSQKSSLDRLIFLQLSANSLQGDLSSKRRIEREEYLAHAAAA